VIGICLVVCLPMRAPYRRFSSSVNSAEPRKSSAFKRAVRYQNERSQLRKLRCRAEHHLTDWLIVE